MNKCKLFLLILLLLNSGFFLNNAFADNYNQKVNITISTNYASRYISRGLDFMSENDPVIEPSIDIAFPDLVADTDVSFNVWSAFPLRSGHLTSTEVDFSVTASRDFDKFNISSGYTYFDYPKANENSDLNEFWGSFSWFEFPGLPLPICAALFAAYEFEAAAEGPENGWYYSWGLASEFELPDIFLFQKEQKTTIDVTNWGNDGVYGLKPDILYATEFSISTSYSFKGFSISPGLHYALNYDDINSGDDELWFSLDVSYAF